MNKNLDSLNETNNDTANLSSFKRKKRREKVYSLKRWRILFLKIKMKSVVLSNQFKLKQLPLLMSEREWKNSCFLLWLGNINSLVYSEISTEWYGWNEMFWERLFKLKVQKIISEEVFLKINKSLIRTSLLNDVLSLFRINLSQ